MLGENIASLRKMKNMTQEELADLLGIARQTVSKWESGESAPDLEKAKALADIFEVALDNLVNYEIKDNRMPIPPKGLHTFGMVTVGEKGQIVIPVKARKIFDINPGDKLIILGDETKGLALINEKQLMALLKATQEITE